MTPEGSGRGDRRDVAAFALLLAEHNVCSAEQAYQMPYSRVLQYAVRIVRRLQQKRDALSS